MIEEQHVTHYESLIDPLDSWLKQLVFTSTTRSTCTGRCSRKRATRASRHCGISIATWRSVSCTCVCDLLRKYEGVEPEEILPPAVPDTPVTFEPNKQYVRDITASQCDLRTDGVRLRASRRVAR